MISFSVFFAASFSVQISRFRTVNFLVFFLHQQLIYNLAQNPYLYILTILQFMFPVQAGISRLMYPGVSLDLLCFNTSNLAHAQWPLGTMVSMVHLHPLLYRNLPHFCRCCWYSSLKLSWIGPLPSIFTAITMFCSCLGSCSFFLAGLPVSLLASICGVIEIYHFTTQHPLFSLHWVIPYNLVYLSNLILCLLLSPNSLADEWSLLSSLNPPFPHQS